MDPRHDSFVLRIPTVRSSSSCSRCKKLIDSAWEVVILKVNKQFFSGIGEVLEDVKANQTWPTTFVSGPSKGLPEHWHDYEVHAYLMEGETWFLDGESGEKFNVTAGDKIIIPSKALHAEGEVEEKAVYIVAIPEPVTNKEFLVMRTAGTVNGSKG